MLLDDEVTLSQAKELIMALGQTQSILLLASPGVGKSDIIREISQELETNHGYGPCKTLLGTQIAPEDVSGIPKIIKDRSVFCPPEILLPAGDSPKPFVLFLDELPICAPDVQKAMYSLLLDRKLGEHDLPKGTIVVAAGNNVSDRAMVRSMSSALVNRVIILHVKVDVQDWIQWGQRVNPKTGRQNVRKDILDFIQDNQDMLQDQEIPEEPNTPFATPRSWTTLSNAMDCLEAFRQKQAEREGAMRGLTETDILSLGQGTVGLQKARQLCIDLHLRQNPEDIDYEPQNELLEVTLNQAKDMITAIGQTQSIMLLSSPGTGKSDIVRAISQELEAHHGYGPCKTLLGTQIAPEDVSGIPMIVNDRSVFFPPAILLPPDDAYRPFVLFLDELPICSPDVQKAMYSLLLDRKLGERDLPKGTIVVAAGNNVSDRAMVRIMSSALVNRVIILHIKVDVADWIQWGRETNTETKRQNVREEILDFISANPECLQTREIPDEPNTPFATPRSWTMLSNSLDRLEEFRAKQNWQEEDKIGVIRILSRGTIGMEAADSFCDYVQFDYRKLSSATYYIEHPEDIPHMTDSKAIAQRAAILSRVKDAFATPAGSDDFKQLQKLGEERILAFFRQISPEFSMVMIKNCIDNMQRLAPGVLRQLAVANPGK